MSDGPRDDFEIDFFGIGAPRSGSTWLATVLDEHPEISISRPKEANFFVERADIFYAYRNPQYLKDWAWYRSCFDHAPADTSWGEFSVNMFNNVHSAPQAVKRHFPDARFVLVLRDPVRRTYSHWWYHYGMHRQWGGLPETFADAIHHTSLVWRSRYGAQLAHWFRHFHPDRFHVILDMDLRRDSARVVRDAYRFLGVDETFRPPSLDVRVNTTKRRLGIYETAYRLATRLREAGLDRAVDAVKRLPVERLLDRVDVTRARPPAMDPVAADELRRMLWHDIELLEDLIDRDLSAWRDGTREPKRWPRQAHTTELEKHLSTAWRRPGGA